MIELLQNPNVAISHQEPLLYSHWSEVPWDFERWPNFSPGEPRLACPRNGEFYFDTDALDRLQYARKLVGESFKINSGHRSPIHNALVGGKPLSQHLKLGFDISILNHKDPMRVYTACRESGFTGFGFYFTFLHVDTGRARRWFTKLGEKRWTSLLA